MSCRIDCLKRVQTLTFLCLLFLSSNVLSQNSDFGNWMIYFGNKSLGSGFNLHHEVQYRNYNIAGDLEQLLLRTGIGLNLSENNNNALLGYGFVHGKYYRSDSDEIFHANEHRIFQQFMTRQSFNRLFLQHRYRFEQRFFAEDFRLRFRYFLALNILLNNDEMLRNTWYLSSYNELFVQPTGEPFDRNRLYGGVGYKVSDSLRLEVGYMNQFLQFGNRDQLNLMAFLSF